MSKKTAENKNDDMVEFVKVKKICIDSGNLGIETKFGTRFFPLDKEMLIPREEAEEIIKVRTEQRSKLKNQECDLVIVE